MNIFVMTYEENEFSYLIFCVRRKLKEM
jgi:hypothetical protein